MSGKAISGRSRQENRGMRPVGCHRCGRKVKDGTGRRVDGKLLCPRCQARQDTTQPERPAP
jgi:formylmethanofuran dehydrogenase subunit E